MQKKLEADVSNQALWALPYYEIKTDTFYFCYIARVGRVFG
jgi:hypothetical protein